MQPTNHLPAPSVVAARWVAVASLLALIVLGLAWELWLAPLRPGGSWLALKVLPLCIPLAGLLKSRMYTYRWLSLMVWLYFTEGVVRGWSDRAPGQWLALVQVLLCVLLFVACTAHIRLRNAKITTPTLAPHPPPPTPAQQALCERLRSLLGHTHVLTEGDLRAYEQDWRQRERGRALAVARPGSTAEVAAVVQACAAAGVSLVPQGGNTGMVVGSTPDASGTQVVLSLQRLQHIRQLDAANLTVTVEAGCVLQTLQEACAAQGFLFPLSLASEGSCTIGGNLATNAGGTQVVRYGNMRELCLGLEVVTAQGQVWEGLTGLRKDNTGYDLRHLFIGSEGTLGVITAATLRIYPLPRARWTAFAALPSLDAAVQLLGLAHRHLHAGLTGFEVMGAHALGLVRTHFPQLRIPFAPTGAPEAPGTHSTQAAYCVVLEHSDHASEAHARVQLEGLLAAALEQGWVHDAVVADSLAQAQMLWHIRESIPLAQAQEGLNIKHDISISVSRIPAFVRETDAALALAVPGVRMVTYGHLGDGNLHYNVQAPIGADGETFLREQEDAVNTLVYDQVQRFGGSISAEHGIGSLKRDTLAHYKSPVALAAMRSIKAALDPDNRLNPGRVLHM